jgi:hypothetical protein
VVEVEIVARRGGQQETVPKTRSTKGKIESTQNSLRLTSPSTRSGAATVELQQRKGKDGGGAAGGDDGRTREKLFILHTRAASSLATRTTTTATQHR